MATLTQYTIREGVEEYDSKVEFETEDELNAVRDIIEAPYSGTDKMDRDGRVTLIYRVDGTTRKLFFQE